MPIDRTLERSSGAAVDRYHEKSRQRRRVHRRNAILVVFAAMFALAVIFAVGWYRSVSLALNDETIITNELIDELAPQHFGDEPFYMLLLGTDGRPGEDVYRSDSMMLVRVDPSKPQLTLVSLPRDTRMMMNGEYQKLNAAYAYGGAAGAVAAVSSLAGVDISHYAQVDFDGFCSIVDEIGGVEIDIPTPIVDMEYAMVNLQPGRQLVDGETALKICRARHAYDEYGDGDMYRAANQRAVLSAIIKKVLSSDAATMGTAITKMADHASTDLTIPEILSLANQMRGLDFSENVYSGVEPTISEFDDEVWYELCDVSAWQRMMDRVDAGLPPYEDDGDDYTVGVSVSL